MGRPNGKVGSLLNRVLRARLRETVVVSLKSRATFRGVLMDADSHALVLRNVEALHVETVDSDPPKLDGELIVLIKDVDYIQRTGT
ncbi:hypothetical protein GCM10012275_28350 [Longimycelium tulufanense]|uniref:Uncharacterized protein n=1 Tax=Longimycelium tulufanense TaxID=907463 RepID=A0A8J3CBQ0_9PSEU|nr:hypothetical protein GCM10012275_28350 [Longimycelium tulufanense]